MTRTFQSTRSAGGMAVDDTGATGAVMRPTE
jgi:hypothetical protein